MWRSIFNPPTSLPKNKLESWRLRYANVRMMKATLLKLKLLKFNCVRHITNAAWNLLHNLTLSPSIRRLNKIIEFSPKKIEKHYFHCWIWKLDSFLTAPHRIYVAYECEDIGKRYYGKWSLPVYGDVVWNWILCLKVTSKSIFAFETEWFGASGNFKMLSAFPSPGAVS